jgi:hypothetical protein
MLFAAVTHLVKRLSFGVNNNNNNNSFIKELRNGKKQIAGKL